MPRNTTPAAKRVSSRVAVDAAGCHIYTGAICPSTGYGKVGLGPRDDGVGYTHRVMYEAANGPIPDGLHIDHLCRTRSCCNPAHLEAVTQAENNRRQKRDNPKTHCIHGHEFTPENTIQTQRQRFCRACREQYNARRRKDKP